MRKLKGALVLVLGVLLGVLSAAALAQRALVPVIDYKDVSVATRNGKPLTAEQVREAIVAAGKNLQWDMTFAADGGLVGTLVVRNKHTISVDISVAPEKYSVKYRNSINMKYGIAETPTPRTITYGAPLRGEVQSSIPEGQGIIHPAYNQWVQALMAGIEAELRKL